MACPASPATLERIRLVFSTNDRPTFLRDIGFREEMFRKLNHQPVRQMDSGQSFAFQFKKGFNFDCDICRK